MNRGKKARECADRESKRQMEKIALQSLGHQQRADKKEGDDDRCFFGPHVPTRRLPTPPVVD
jgi:hypothetical protein